jgi:hypothetical protein
MDSESPKIRGRLRCVFGWFAIGVFLLVLLIVLFYIEEDWRGARAWAACQKELQAKGEILDLRQLAPPGKPKDNLSKVPIFAEIYQQPPPQYIGLIRQDIPKPTRLDRINIHLGSTDYHEYPKSVNYLDGQSIDLTAWQQFYRSLPEVHLPAEAQTPAQDVLSALSQLEPEMDEVEGAASNPNAYWPLNYDKPFDTRLGGITSMLRVANVLHLRAIAHLDNHEPALAEKDYLLSFRLNQPLAQNCLLVNYLVILADRVIDDSILWEGIHRHIWTVSQLQEMESALATVDMLELAAKSFRLERACSLQTLNVMEEIDLYSKLDVFPGYNQGARYFFRVRPKGWWSQDRRVHCLDVQRQIDAISLSRGTFAKISESETRRSIVKTIYTPLAQALCSVFDSIDHKIAQAETTRRLARIACRLEEYYLAHRQYPERLDELPDLPAHLNQEVLSEQPLRYARKGNGYLLYSTGWDQVDHGGVRRGPLPERAEYDWIWPSP